MDKIFRIFFKFVSALVVLALVIFQLPQAFAAGFVTLNSFSGPPTTIVVSGGGYSGGETVSIYLGSMAGSPATTTITDGVGNFSASVTIPLSTPQGPLAVISTDSGGLTVSNSYYVVPYVGSISVTGSNNTPGSTVTISGSGYAPGETVNFILDGQNGGSAVADNSGSFSKANFTIPNVPAATYQLHATGASSGADAIDYFYVGGFYPTASPSAYYVLPGGQLNFSGSGFAPGEKINVTVNSSPTLLSNFTVDGSGSFTSAGSFSVPLNLTAGINTFNLTGSLGHSASLMLTVGSFNAQVSPSAYFLNSGNVLNFSGSGFAPNETVVVSKGGQQVASFSADPNGSFTNVGNITIPFSDAGSVKPYTLTGQTSHTSGTVNIGVAAFNATILPSAYYVSPGQSFTVSGSGFAPGEIVDVTSGSSSQAVTASSSGAFITPAVNAPFAPGPLTITAIGQTSQVSAAVGITVGQLYPSVQPSRYYVLPGDTITFSGSGFAAGETVNGSSGVGSAVTDNTGAFASLSFSVPTNISGSQTYKFTGSKSGAVASVTLTVAALNPYASSDSYYATPGSTVHISAAGFASNETVMIALGSSSVTAKVSLPGGSIAPTAFTIPFNSANPAVVTLTGQTSGAKASVPITLAPFAAQVSPSLWYAPPGSLITFSGNGFAPSEAVNVSLNNSAASSTMASAAGSINIQLMIPFNATSANFTFTGAISHATANVPITLAQLNPGIQLSSYYNSGGTPLVVTGMGFAASEKVDVSFSGTVLGTVTADASGNFSLNSTVPFTAAGNKTVLARGQSSGAVATANFTLPQTYVNVQLGSYAGAPGSSVDFIGSGFAPGETINITTDRTGGTVVRSFAADATGKFNDTGYVIPQSFSQGNLTLTITGSQSQSPQSIVYYVTGP